MRSEPVRYESPEEDSARWEGFTFREGDIVISTRSKSGTTWMQMICALLVFQTPDLPAPVSEMSPWLDWLVNPREEVFASLASQTHRRFIKTHTPLDGLPIDPLATYIVVGRHPLDMAVSLYHQGDNLDRDRVRRLTGQPSEPSRKEPARPPVGEWLREWIDADVKPATHLDSLPGVMWHMTDAWARRAEPNVLLVHYDDLLADLEGEMRRVAARLGIAVPDDVWMPIVDAASFDSMRARAAGAAPGTTILKDPLAFFRRGTSGAGRELLTDDEMDDYRIRVAAMGPPELVAWLHRDRDLRS